MRRAVKKRFDRWWIIPPILLVLVSSLHPLRVHFSNLDRWEGGGFGMFTSVDRLSNRSLRLILPTENGEVNGFLLPMKESRRRLLILPDPGVLSMELNSLKTQPWAIFSLEQLAENAQMLESSFHESGSLLRTYQSGVVREDLAFDRYSSVALPADITDEGGQSLRLSGNPRLDVHRLVYNGDGVFSSRLLTTSPGKE